MTSSVFFRFKSQREPSRVTFDGTGISVFELKRDIIAQTKLGDGTDFELIINSEDTNEVYEDDTSIIPRSTTVIAKRLPAVKAGRGGAARYVSGKMPQNAKNSHRQEVQGPKPTNTANDRGLTTIHSAQTEEERIAAMFRMGADDWVQQQQQMANAAPVHRGGPLKGKPQNLPGHPPPPGYICYRCGEKGHWIMECPTNNDPTYDGRPRIKRTTGIPKSFLKTIEKPTTLVNDGTIDDTRQPSGVMVNAEGDWVVAEPDQAAWDKYQAQAKVSAAAQNAVSQGSKELQERGIECAIDKHLFVDPCKTPCCQTTYCHECIQNALLDNDLRCPNCLTENVPIDDLAPDTEMRTQVRRYEEEKAAEILKARQRPDNPTAQADKGASLANHTKSPSRSPSSKSSILQTAPTGSGTPKKRPAGSELENDRKLSGLGKVKSSGTLANLNASNGGTKQEHVKQHMLTTATTGLATNSPASFNGTPFPGINGFMGMGVATPMSMTMQNPMMMPTAPFMPNGWAMGLQQNVGMSRGVFGTGSMDNNGVQNPQNLSMNNYPNMNALGPNNMAMNGQFANQQRSRNEEESAYFRKPVNPNRQYHRRNWNQNRPADYREI